MPCDYRIDKSRRLVISRGYDVVTEADLSNHCDRLVVDPDFDPHYSQLFDFSEVTQFLVTSADIQGLATRPVFAPTSLRAFVAPDDAIYGNARAYLSWSGEKGVNINVFREAGSALRWLGIEPSDHTEEHHEELPSD